ncbi:MAG: AMP-binding protein [Pseudomonadota bacterium]
MTYAAPSPTLPLIRHFAPGSALAWTDQAVSPQQFIALASKLAAGLPAGRPVLNLCEDRYHFLLAFAAALIAGRLTLTPASRAADAIARIQGEFGDSHVVTDQMLAAALLDFSASADPLPATPAALSIPEIPADQAAVILFTSGSSGQPAAHSKTWGMLVQGADQLQRAFNVSPGSCVLGTVPPQHMFGLESTILFPLQWGCTIHHERPLLPADIEQAVRAARAPVWLMTTPVHLRACVSEGMPLSGIAGAISATMPLDQAGARAAEQILACPLYEIYGSTEAGITGTRRPAQELEWQLCPDFRLRTEAGQSWLEGARVAQPLALSDSVELAGPGRFSLHGRTGDMIKIAGKRTSLAALNAELLAIEGVTDGSFYRPPSPGSGSHDDQRLTAFVVAPQLDARDIIAELRKRIDSVFIPRPLWKVAQMPRDSNGKLPQAELARLAASMSAPADATTAAPADSLSGVIAADHPALDGHFPGNPVVPGVLLLSEVIRLATRSRHIGGKPGGKISGIKQAKFHAPLRPGQAYAISLSQTSPTALKFVIQHEQTLIASGLLQCEAQHVPE